MKKCENCGAETEDSFMSEGKCFARKAYRRWEKGCGFNLEIEGWLQRHIDSLIKKSNDYEDGKK